MKKASIVLLLAQERSGTHMLRSILGRLGRIAAPGETCNAAADASGKNELSFFDFRRSYLTDRKNSPYPTYQHQTLLIKEYFQYILKRIANHEFVILDIKYSHVHNFNAGWWDFSSRPTLLAFAKDHSIEIIHLVRENVFQTAISDFYATQSGVWRAVTPQELKKVSITVDSHLLRRQMRHIERTIALFDEWLIGCKHLRITYEALCGPAPAEPLQKISEFLRLEEVIPFKPEFLKTTPPYEECIVNWDEIKNLAAA